MSKEGSSTTGSRVGAGGIGVGAGGPGVDAGVGVAAGGGVGVAFTVTVRVASGPVSDYFAAGVESAAFSGSIDSALFVLLSCKLVGDACELSRFVLATMFGLSSSFLLLAFLNIDTVGLKFIPAMICSRVAAILIATWSDARGDSAFTMSVCCAGSESGGAVWHPLTLAKRAVVRRAVRIFFMGLILSWCFS